MKCGIVLAAFLSGHLLGQSEYNRVAERLLLSETERSTLDTENQRLSSELSEMVQKAYGNDEAVAALQQSLAEMRVQGIEEREELQMFRNLSAGGENITGLAIDNVAISAIRGSQYELDLRLTQPRGRKRVAGTLAVMIIGESASGDAQALPLEDIRLDATDRQISSSQTGSAGFGEFPDFDFRYFQRFQANLILPEGFKPELLEIVADPVNPYRPSLKKETITVPWETSHSADLASLTN